MCMTPLLVLKEQSSLGDVLWGSEVHGLSTVGGSCPPLGSGCCSAHWWPGLVPEMVEPGHNDCCL